MRLLPTPVKDTLKRVILASQPAASDSAWPIEDRELEGWRIRWPKDLGWRPGAMWVEPLLHGFRARVPVKLADIPQPLAGTVLIEVHRNREMRRVAINGSDYPDLIHFGTLEGTKEDLALEFKMQYRNAGYGIDGIVPGGYVSDVMLIDWYAQAPRRERDAGSFCWDVYGRFGLQFAAEVRSKAINTLREQTRFAFFGGDRKVRFSEFLREIARSRVCIDLPGNGPFCFRLVNYLAVGACVISPPHQARMPVPLVDRQHIVYTKPDMSDLVDLCARYVNDSVAREMVMRAGRDYYRRHLYWRSLSDYYLRMMLDRLPE